MGSTRMRNRESMIHPYDSFMGQLLLSLFDSMADENATGNSNTETSESIVEINIKTLDSQIYRFRVDRNIPVPSLKEKVASQSGVPVEQQRLIFRGKVLKDDHLLSEKSSFSSLSKRFSSSFLWFPDKYLDVEGGHTLHLVVRQPVQSQTPTGGNSGEASGHSDTRASLRISWEMMLALEPHVTGLVKFHTVYFLEPSMSGTKVVKAVVQIFRPGDLSRIIGAVLNSIGIGSQTPTGGSNNLSSGMPSNGSSQTSQGVDTDRTREIVVVGARQQTTCHLGRHSPIVHSSSVNQSLPFPLTGAAVVVPSPQMFMNRMELALSATGYWQSPSPVNVEDSPREIYLLMDGTAYPEALIVILRRAQQLISGHGVAAISHIAGRLESEGGSNDSSVRNQIQTESVQVGLAMQHLGSLLLELGRTILTLRMGQSPAESLVNTGPAVYVSPSGPSPIMVQPFPLQTSSMFGGSASSQAIPGTMGPLGPGDALRNVNIHIHAVGSRATNGEHTRQEYPNGSRSANNVLNAIHPQARTQQNNQSHPPHSEIPSTQVSSTPQPSIGNSPAESVSNLVSEINAQLTNLVDSIRGGNQVPSGQSEDSTRQGLSSETGTNNNLKDPQQENLTVNGADQSEASSSDCISEREDQQQLECNQASREEGEIGGIQSSKEASSSTSTGFPSSSPGRENSLPVKSEDNSEEDSKSSPIHEPLAADKAVPLGLGLGGLQPPKRRSRQVRSQGKNVSGTSLVQPISENEQSIATGQEILRSLVSHGSNTNTRDANGPSVQPSPAIGQYMQNLPAGAPDPNGQIDAASMMSQVLNSPALNGLLAGVSEQAGIGSPGGLRNMLEQFTQSPSIRNTLNQIVQQVDGQELGNLSELARGQGGGLDLSRMVQQMMPLVSQALTGLSTSHQPSHGLESRDQRQSNISGQIRVDKPDQNSQTNLPQIAQSIGRNDPPGDVFRSVVEHAASLSEFMEMLHRNMP
ncbi:hypothetical protein IFM89_021803 [Coptis chinensis]|uniref:Ubiquitin-like domain-containing protein n=1 Tax=Coptis chinensis TaxID=261450 RepID=A0A835IQ72_9MAGN|nr:hypothetical protein IFM89_021803 [Coptis chinensis]